MRVLISQLPTAGHRTGIGHYTAQLLRCLREQAAGDDIDAYPDGWLWLATHAWVRLTASWRKLRARSRGLGWWARPVGVLPRLAFHGLKRWGRSLHDRRFRAAFLEGNYDVYHEPNFIPVPCDLPTVITIHDLSVLLHPQWHPPRRVAEYERGFLRGLSQCCHILTGSDFVRRQVIEVFNFPPAQVTRAYYGIRPHLGPLRPQQTARTLQRLRLVPNYLLYLGTLEPRKNILMLMQAYCGLPAGLRERCPLVLAGSWGWKAEPVADYYQTEGRHRGVYHLGYVPDTYLAALYNGARGLVYPSLYEGFGLPPVEMMACGGAVLASDIDAIAESARGQAHLIDPHDEDAWRQALARLITEDDWWSSLRRGAIQTSKGYTWDRCAAETLAVYRLVGGSAAQSHVGRARAA
jgi:glycosyltransferase involved in cell wall biosynthesis